jgi:hypothetical protein
MNIERERTATRERAFDAALMAFNVALKVIRSRLDMDSNLLRPHFLALGALPLRRHLPSCRAFNLRS